MNITISLTSDKTGLTLEAQLQDNAGAPVGGVITTGFVEFGSGTYMLSTPVDDDFEGGIVVWEAGIPATILGGAAINTSPADDVWSAMRDGYTVQGTFGESFSTMIPGTAVGFTNTSETMVTNLTKADNDFYVGRTVVWVTGGLQGAAAAITGYDGATKTLEFTPVKVIPVDGDNFLII